MQKAFSLVELSIVLVILGLLVGGVLSGQSLIRAAELRAITREYEAYITAVGSFREKYFALPGDMTNATSFWGAADNGDGMGNDCSGTDSSGLKTTCNGNGDGMIDYLGSVPNGRNEIFRFWQHLSNAGFITGSYSGRSSLSPSKTSAFSPDSGINIPQSRWKTAGWYVEYWDSGAGDNLYYANTVGNQFLFISDVSNGVPIYPVLKAEDAWNIDTKLDDGIPGTGKIMGGNRSACTTSTSATDYTSPYNLTSSAISCFLIFRGSF